MTNLQILSKSIRTLDNLYSLNDLHFASGNDVKHRPSLFARNEQTKELVKEIENERSTKTIFALKTIRGGADISKQGTWACKELVIAYAAWISPAFHLTVLRAFLNQVEQPQQLALPEPEKKIIDNKNKPQYTGVLSKNTKRLPHPSDLAVFLCQFNGGTIAGKYNTLMGIPSSGFLCIPESESRHPQTNVANLSKNTKELAMANIITAHYNGTEVFFQDDAYLNATAIAKYFNKRPNDWLALPTTQEYIETLCKKTETRKSGNATKVGKSHFVKTVKGGKDLSQQGTWLHRRLAVAFARWLNVEFAIWCDEQIEKILISKNQPQQLALPEPDLNLTAIQNSEETLALIIQLYSYCFQAHEMQEKLQNTSIAKLMENQIGGQYLYNFKHPLEQVMAKAKKYVHSNTERLALVKAVNNLLN